MGFLQPGQTQSVQASATSPSCVTLRLNAWLPLSSSRSQPDVKEPLESEMPQPHVCYLLVPF